MNNGDVEFFCQDNRKEDDGRYTCIISNSYGSINHTIEVRDVNRKEADDGLCASIISLNP
jgi:hypothetical protein